MNRNVFIMMLLAVFFGVGAVFASNIWLAGQRSLLGNRTEAKSRETIVVAAVSLRFGDRLTAENLREIPWTAGDRPAGSFKFREELLGSENNSRQVLTAIASNEPILEWKITGPGQRATLSAVLADGMKAVSLRVNDVLGVAGFVFPGDRVDILLTRNDNANNNRSGFVDVLLQSIKVLAIDQVADDRKDDPTVVRTVTLEVTTEDAQKLTLAAGIGQLSLALRKMASNEGEQTKRITLADLVGDTPDDVERRADEAEKRLEEERERFKNELSSLRMAVEKTGTRIEERIDDVTSQMKGSGDETEPQVREVIVYKDPPKPVNVTVGVTRDFKRDVYDVPSEREDKEAID